MLNISNYNTNQIVEKTNFLRRTESNTKLASKFFPKDKYHIMKKFKEAEIIIDKNHLKFITTFIENNDCDSLKISKPYGFEQTGYIKISILSQLIKKLNYWIKIQITDNKTYLILNNNQLGSDYYLTYPKKKNYETGISGAFKALEGYNKDISKDILYFKFIGKQDIDIINKKIKSEYFKSHFKYLHYDCELIKLPKLNFTKNNVNNIPNRSGLMADKNLGKDLFMYCLNNKQIINLIQFKNALIEMDKMNSHNIFYKDSKIENSLMNPDNNVYFIDFDNADNFSNIMESLKEILLDKPFNQYTERELFSFIEKTLFIIHGTKMYLPNSLMECIINYFSNYEMMRRILLCIDLYGNILTILLSCTKDRFNLFINSFNEISFSYFLDNITITNKLNIFNKYILITLKQLQKKNKNIDFSNCYKLLSNLKEFIKMQDFNEIATREHLLGLSKLN